MPASRSYTDIQNARARDVVAELVRRMGNQRRVADALEISQPALSAFVLGKYGIGPAVMRRLASLANMTERQLVGDEPTAPVVADEYPNRGPVIEFARRVGYSATVVRRLAEIRPTEAVDVPSTEWVRLLVMLDTIEASPFMVGAEASRPRRRSDKQRA